MPRAASTPDAPVITADGRVLYAPHPPRLVDEVTPGFWLGGSWARHPAGHGGYDLVVSVHHPDEQLNTPRTTRHLSVPMGDHGTVDEPAVQRAVAAIVKAHRAGKLVAARCWTGQNRSGLVTALALLELDPRRSPAEVVEHLRAVRAPWVLCNPAFEAHVLAAR